MKRRPGLPSARRSALLGALSLQAVHLAEAGRRRAALERVSRMLALEPMFGWALFFRAGLRVLDGRAREAARDLEAMRDAPLPMMFAGGREMEVPRPAGVRGLDARLTQLLRLGESPWSYALKAFFHRESGQWDLGRAAIDRALELAPKDAALWALSARVKYAFRLPAEASKAMERAWRLAPDCFWICAWLGEVKRYAGDWKAAERLLDRSIRLNPQYLLAYSWRGGVRRVLGRPREGLRDLDCALRAEWRGEDDNASFSWALHERSLAKREIGDHAGAFRDLNAAHRINQRYVWSEGLRRGGQPSPGEALSRLDAIIALSPKSAWALAWRGYTHATAGRGEEGTRDLQRALSLNPGLAWAYAWKAGADLDAGRGDSALKDLTRSIRLDPGYALSRRLRGQYLLRLGRPAEACRDLRASVKLDRFSALAWAELGKALGLLGRRKEAGRCTEEARNLDPRVICP